MHLELYLLKNSFFETQLIKNASGVISPAKIVFLKPNSSKMYLAALWLVPRFNNLKYIFRILKISHKKSHSHDLISTYMLYLHI